MEFRKRFNFPNKIYIETHLQVCLCAVFSMCSRKVSLYMVKSKQLVDIIIPSFLKSFPLGWISSSSPSMSLEAKSLFSPYLYVKMSVTTEPTNKQSWHVTTDQSQAQKPLNRSSLPRHCPVPSIAHCPTVTSLEKCILEMEMEILWN